MPKKSTAKIKIIRNRRPRKDEAIKLKADLNTT
jgi:hypothetical protein